MKKESDDLYQLINTLTAAEKRYCSLYLKKHSAAKDNRYLKLFSYLEVQDEYDSASIRKLMGFEKKANHYSVLKRQLYQQLLDALYQYSLFTERDEQLVRGIYQAQLLLKKGLYAQCEKKIEVLEKTARAMDSDTGRIKLQHLKFSAMSRQGYSRASDQDLCAWEQQTKDILKGQESNIRYQYLQGKLGRTQKDAEPFSRELLTRMKNIIDLPEFADEKNALTLSAKLNYYNAWGMYYYHSLDMEKALECLEKQMLLFESNPLMASFSRNYSNTLTNYMATCIKLRKYESFENGLKKLRALPKTTPSWETAREIEEPFIFSAGYSLESIYMTERGMFEAGYARIKQIKHGIKKFGDRIVTGHRMGLQYGMAYFCFGLGKYDEALEHLLPLTQANAVASGETTLLKYRMLQLVCHFEKGNTLLLPSLIKSLQRLLTHEDESADDYRAIVAFINSSLRKTNIDKKQWKELYNKLREPETDDKGTTIKLSDYDTWAAAHAEGISFMEAWKKTAAG